MILETIPAITSLTVDQKLRLVRELWADVSHDPGMPPGVAELLDEKPAEFEANPASTWTMDGVTAGSLRLKRRIAASRP